MSIRQLVPSPPRPVAANPASSAESPLLRFAGPIAGCHALVIAPDGVELLCSLLRSGCAAATSLRMAERPEHENYDLVLVPQLTGSAQIGRLIYQAKRALVPTGRFLAFVPATASDQDAAGVLVRSVRLGGFVDVQTKATGDGLLLRADLPMHGLGRGAPCLVRSQA